MKRFLPGALSAAAVLGACLLAARSPVVLELIREEGWRIPRLLLAVAAAGAAAGAAAALLSRAGVRAGRPIPAAGPAWAGAALALSIAICLIPLAKAWLDAGSDGGALFGLLPWSDAGEYHRGAQSLLLTGKLDEWNLRRPLNASLLAVRLALSGGDLRGALLIQAALAGVSICTLARTVGRDLGWPGGLALFVSAFVFAAAYLHLFLSEILGLTFGAIGLALLWEAASRGDRRLLGLGACAETLALHARAGPFLMLPALALWALLSWKGDRRARAAACGAVVLGIAAATAFNAGIVRIHGGRLGNSHGNFYFTLYGLSAGTPGWTRVYDDYPGLRAMGEAEGNAFIREKAFARIRKDPGRLAEGLSAGWGLFLQRVPEILGGLENFLPGKGRRWFFLPLLSGGFLLFLYRRGRRPETTMAFLMLAGVLASVPVLWTDGGGRVFAAAIPLVGLVPAFGLAGWRPDGEPAPAVASGIAAWGVAGGAVPLLLALMLAAAAGPTLARRMMPGAPTAFRSPSSLPYEAVIRSDAPAIRVLASGAPGPTFVPEVVRGQFLGNLALYGNREFRRIPEEGVVMLARDWAKPGAGRQLFVVGPRPIAERPPRYLYVKGDYSGKTGILNVSEWRVLGAAR